MDLIEKIKNKSLTIKELVNLIEKDNAENKDVKELISFLIEEDLVFDEIIETLKSKNNKEYKDFFTKRIQESNFSVIKKQAIMLTLYENFKNSSKLNNYELKKDDKFLINNIVSKTEDSNCSRYIFSLINDVLDLEIYNKNKKIKNIFKGCKLDEIESNLKNLYFIFFVDILDYKFKKNKNIIYDIKIKNIETIRFLIKNNRYYNAMNEAIILFENRLRKTMVKRDVNIFSVKKKDFEENLLLSNELIEKYETKTSKSSIKEKIHNNLQLKNEDFQVNSMLLNKLLTEILSSKEFEDIHPSLDFIKFILLSNKKKGLNLRNIIFHGLENEKTLGLREEDCFFITYFLLNVIEFMEIKNGKN